jgi:predicted Ser/Thr protein kinase
MSTGRHIGKYEIQQEIGRGSFGVVYRARDASLDRLVALKVLHPQLATDLSFVQRFHQEARAAASLTHAHIVTVYEVGEEAGQYYLAMAYLSGRTLDKWIEAGGLTVNQAVAFTQQIAGALDEIHAHGLVHRDVKPANIMVDDRGRATLLDFGIVRAAEGTRLTTTMGVLGTPEYMAPEQAEVDETKEIDWRADVYALGVVAYEMLVGRPPFTGTSPTAILYKHVYEPPPAPTALNAELPPVLEPVLIKALAKERADRHQSAGEMAAQLRQAVSGAPKEEPVGRQLIGTGTRPIRTEPGPVAARPAPSSDERAVAQPGTGFWLGWVAANTAGWIIGLILGAGFLSALQESFLGSFLGAFALGLSTGAMQWFALRRHLRQPGQWVWASVGGTLFGAFALSIVPQIYEGGETWGLVLVLGMAAVVFGACLGLAQALVLRDQYRGAGWWVLASMAAWAVAGVVNGGIGVAMASSLEGGSGASSFGEAIGQILVQIVALILVVGLSIVVITGPVSGAITGAALLRLLRHPKDGQTG